MTHDRRQPMPKGTSGIISLTDPMQSQQDILKYILYAVRMAVMVLPDDPSDKWRDFAKQLIIGRPITSLRPRHQVVPPAISFRLCTINGAVLTRRHEPAAAST